MLNSDSEDNFAVRLMNARDKYSSLLERMYLLGPRLANMASIAETTEVAELSFVDQVIIEHQEHIA